jgi:hypothetical protein
VTATSRIRSFFSAQSLGTIMAKEIQMAVALARLILVGSPNPNSRVPRGKWLDVPAGQS